MQGEGSFVDKDEYLAMRVGCAQSWADEALKAIWRYWEGKELENEPLVELLEKLESLAYNTRRAMEDVLESLQVALERD